MPLLPHIYYQLLVHVNSNEFKSTLFKWRFLCRHCCCCRCCCYFRIGAVIQRQKRFVLCKRSIQHDKWKFHLFKNKPVIGTVNFPIIRTKAKHFDNEICKKLIAREWQRDNATNIAIERERACVLCWMSWKHKHTHTTSRLQYSCDARARSLAPASAPSANWKIMKIQ